ncbi:MAG: heparinase II/III family protein [Phenylobacterium sp.]|uniref:heparinase II/III family protein n=1 Tax=Phenylobacterium sp. TaxID=1871053 RepID=UPI003919C7E0
MAGGPPASVHARALVQGVRRLVAHEWAGNPLHRALLAHPKPEGLAAAPKDPRPADAEAGARILAGRFAFAGSVLETGVGGDPWDRPSPSRRFAATLHRFEWMRDLVAAGEAGEREGLRLTLEWRRLFGRWNAFSWSPEVLERRVFNLACAARPICARASDAEVAQISLDLARQARHLLSGIDGPVRAAERAAVAALAGTVLGGAAGQKLIDKALARLTRALAATVAPDGGHASRSPRAALELLFDLQALDEALVQRGIAAPEEMTRALDRLAGAVRFFTLADGALPELNGGEAGGPAYVAAARASEDRTARPPTSRNGYERLDGKRLHVFADAAAPPPGAWSVTACAQPMALEVLAGCQRMIVASGWSPEAAGPEALRLADAASTATLGDQPCGEPLRGVLAKALGPRLVGAPEAVEARRHEAESALWLELAHHGWVKRFHLRHERRLFLDLALDELRGEDRFTPVGEAKDGRRFIPYAIRFHIHPDVRVSLARDGKSVLLRPADDEAGWRLRSDAPDAAIETSVYFHDGQPRRSQQVVLRGQARIDGGARIRWKLAAAEAWPPAH